MRNEITLSRAEHERLTLLARRLRVRSIRMISRAKSSHVGSVLSMAEILAVLYGSILRVDPADPAGLNRDRFVLSKGHACAALYAALAERGFLSVADLDTFYADGSALAGHATHTSVPGVECSTGSLGHGLAIACGMALAAPTSTAYRVFAVLSDGECDEGSVWEAAMFASHHHLSNLTVVVDYNRMQSLGRTDEIVGLEPFAAKWTSFGWHAVEVDGHDIEALHGALSCVPLTPQRPTCVIARTVKGKGVSFMEDSLLWHYRTPVGDELQAALAELGEFA
ncbi:MAG TPA: transketolase [Vicinamibacterales bacterium]|nr:transketolase [Vicinamibacterales bacterium]